MTARRATITIDIVSSTAPDDSVARDMIAPARETVRESSITSLDAQARGFVPTETVELLGPARENPTPSPEVRFMST